MQQLNTRHPCSERNLCMEEQELQFIQSKIEALLFAYGEALDAKRIADAVGISEADARRACDALAQKYERDASQGLCMVRHDDAYQLGTKSEHYALIYACIKQDFQQDLSRASLEALSIVLYRAPISRAEIDAIRGVNSSFIVRNLLLRGLVERVPDTKGHHIFLYKPTIALLQLLGISSRESLPDFDTLKKRCDMLFEQNAESENDIVQTTAPVQFRYGGIYGASEQNQDGKIT